MIILSIIFGFILVISGAYIFGKSRGSWNSHMEGFAAGLKIGKEAGEEEALQIVTKIIAQKEPEYALALYLIAKDELDKEEPCQE